VRIKVYLVTELRDSHEVAIAIKLTHEAARNIAKIKGNRRVTRVTVDRTSLENIAIEQRLKEGQSDANRTRSGCGSRLHIAV